MKRHVLFLLGYVFSITTSPVLAQTVKIPPPPRKKSSIIAIDTFPDTPFSRAPKSTYRASLDAADLLWIDKFIANINENRHQIGMDFEKDNFVFDIDARGKLQTLQDTGIHKGNERAKDLLEHMQLPQGLKCFGNGRHVSVTFEKFPDMDVRLSP